MLGGKSVLEWVIRRITDCQRLDAVAVVLAENTLATSAPANNESQHCWAGLVPPDVPVLYSRQADALGDCAEALRQWPARAVVRVSAYNPFLDPVLVDRLVNTADHHVGCDYIGYGMRDGRAAASLSLGLFAEWCRADAVRRAEVEAIAALDRDEVTRFIYSRPEEFGVRFIPLPAELEADDVRRKLDCAEHWELAQTMFDSLGPDEWDWRRLASFVAHPPHPASQRKLKNSLNRSAPV
jgi:spore coat polysaccharide biosynthesis protein SpsF